MPNNLNDELSENDTQEYRFELKFTEAIAHNAAAILICFVCSTLLYCHDLEKEAEVFAVLGSIFALNLVRLEFMYNQNEQ